MADRNPARLAAPFALLAAVVAVALVVATSKVDSTSNPPARSRPAATQPARHARAVPKVYVVKAGDTLTLIADRTGVSLDTIMALNPNVDPNALQTGQRLKLSR
ncbi:MAG: LysM peptidoglycan-binding domain-containing protein [Actinobacteria bacterium]|nr:LysM peptidoglycan-binding domain-containing protein [Actinomycetota bacterium]